ncbi:MAG: branched-chain amino acid transaminase [Candidatus Thermoplasmatota archaeon]|jgi:branched-chain amino acid aminotransferase|nr:branched-chain amino acid transaminase [Candidatus Thermoplasmatota archaeon]MCL5791274.1 branched-chain amino acid transaminase [Candidatus Thermoplasmatota archaeon]
MSQESIYWLNGQFVDESKARVPILTHSLQYGSGIFEGIRAYETPSGSSIFRLRDHMVRFLNTAKIYRMNLGFSLEELENAVREVVKRNNLKSCYIRPFAFYDDDHVGVGTTGKKVSTFIAAIPFGKYFSEADKGLRCKVSSWHRIDSSILPIQAKASGNYLNSVIAMHDAHESGYDEAILTTRDGYVAEGPGENIMMIKNGEIVTPGKESAILLGITRESILTMGKDLGYEVRERLIHREELYTADELFFVGTAAEITPIVNVDGIEIGDGRTGKITSRIREEYFNVVSGKNQKYSAWLTTVS